MTTTFELLADYPAWQDRAACADEPPEVFVGDHRDDDAARRVCDGCPVRRECLDYALQHDERFGIWGGLSERERERLRGLRRR